MKHPAKMWPTSWIFDDHSAEDVDVQIIDILTDIRNLLVLIVLILLLT